MKKILSIIVLGLLLSGNGYAEITDPFEINLTCKDSSVNIPVSISINTVNEKISFQGSDPDSYHLKNDIFVFSMRTDQYSYSYHLNRNTGILRIKTYTFSEEQKNKNMKEVYDSMVANKKINADGTYKQSDLVNLIFELYEQKEPGETIFMECEKSKAKF